MLPQVYQFDNMKPILVLDNHSSHKGASLAVLNELFEVFFTVPYTSNFNCK